jgi:hypothetical protein
MHHRIWALVLATALLCGAFAACGSDDGNEFKTDGGGGDDATASDSTNPFGDDSGYDPDAALLVVMPQNQMVTVVDGQPIPTVQYTATMLGQPVTPLWTIDRGEMGSIDANGVFTPKGTFGGKANIIANYQGKTGTALVTVLLSSVQNGDPNAGDAGGGAGGNGGVGGEGPGGAVSMQTLNVLNGNPVADQGLSWLYPYDNTVWPRGLLAPLLMWKPGAQNDYDAIYIHIHEDFYDYKGYFAKTATPFIHHPIVQKAWQQATYSNGGEDLVVDLVFAKNGTAYGPITEKWKVAKGVLKGTVYYNSYGTNLASNYCCTIGNKSFGAATLAIKPGLTAPTIIAGQNGCRVCHSVAADGARLVTQQLNNYASSTYDLLNNNMETVMSPADGRFGWGALFHDGTFLLSNSADPNMQAAYAQPNSLFALPSGNAVASTGWPNGLRAATPSFSPDGKHVSFDQFSLDKKSLAAMDFDPMNKVFSNLQTLYTPQMGTAVWPTYLPSNDAIVFHLETAYNGRDYAGTRSGCDSSGSCSDSGTHAELWWVDVASKTATRLDKLNGKNYVPVGGNAHNDDSTLNYEPTVNPVVSGGYAWVVFTSRRLYGNVATMNPFWSDPRFHDLSNAPTTKKLWVAAIDLNAMPGTDPSHPAFYLPAQELLAGNSRGFWVVDPCKKDGTTCETGDECCGGYCQSVDGGLQCTPNKPPCAAEFDKCTIDADCCANLVCINGRCSQKGPT